MTPSIGTKRASVLTTTPFAPSISRIPRLVTTAIGPAVLLLSGCVPTNEAGSLIAFNKCLERGTAQQVEKYTARRYRARKFEVALTGVDLTGAAAFHQTNGAATSFSFDGRLKNTSEARIITYVTLRLSAGGASDTKTFQDLFLNPGDVENFYWPNPKVQPPVPAKPSEGYSWDVLVVRGLKYDF